MQKAGQPAASRRRRLGRISPRTMRRRTTARAARRRLRCWFFWRWACMGCAGNTCGPLRRPRQLNVCANGHRNRRAARAQRPHMCSPPSMCLCSGAIFEQVQSWVRVSGAGSSGKLLPLWLTIRAPQPCVISRSRTAFCVAGYRALLAQALTPQRRDGSGELEPATPRPSGGRARATSASLLEAALEHGLSTSRCACTGRGRRRD